MAFDIKGRLKGEKEVINALNRAPQTFFWQLRTWMKDERANMLGGKDSKGRKRKGYREILQRIRKKGDPSKRYWKSQMTNLFRGSIPFAKNIDGLQLKMGLISRSRHQLQLALEMLGQGGTIRSSKKMPVPMLTNIRKAHYGGAISGGSIRTGLKSKAFKFFMDKNRLAPVESGNMTLWYDKTERKKRGDGFRKRGLLFVGTHSIRIRKILTGRRDFFARWNRIQNAAVKRGQTAVDKATRKVERFK